MTAFVQLAALTRQGIRTANGNPERIDGVSREVEHFGVSVVLQWATLGEVGFVSVAEAPDECAMVWLAGELGSRNSPHCRSLAAIRIDESIAS